jgi:hypothetical protein
MQNMPQITPNNPRTGLSLRVEVALPNGKKHMQARIYKGSSIIQKISKG